MAADWPVTGLWIVSGGVTASYVLLFLLARSRVSLRPVRVAGVLGCAVVARAILLGCGQPLMALDGALTGTAAGTVLLLAPLRRTWLLRVSAAEFREQIETACRGLFLEVKETQPCRWVLGSRGEHELHLLSIGSRLQALLLCRARGPGKVPLLLHWLSRQYPGPIPRVRIILKGGKA